jgi:hypothetical protein
MKPIPMGRMLDGALGIGLPVREFWISDTSEARSEILEMKVSFPNTIY